MHNLQLDIQDPTSDTRNNTKCLDWLLKCYVIIMLLSCFMIFMYIGMHVYPYKHASERKNEWRESHVFFIYYIVLIIWSVISFLRAANFGAIAAHDLEKHTCSPVDIMFVIYFAFNNGEIILALLCVTYFNWWLLLTTIVIVILSNFWYVLCCVQLEPQNEAVHVTV